MAENFADDLTWFLQLDVKHKDFLGPIRHWDHLKMAMDESNIWVKNFTLAQLEMVELKSVPFATLFYAKDNYLFPKGSLLPACKIPSLLWTPIDRALPIKLEGFNHNLFEIPGQVKMRLVPSEEQQHACAMLTDFQTAAYFIERAPDYRLKPLSWTIVGSNQVFINGEPLLPINGTAYWQRSSFIFPVGFVPEFPILEAITMRAIDASGENLIWWKNEHQYSLLPVAALQPLTISSWRLTMVNIKNQTRVKL